MSEAVHEQSSIVVPDQTYSRRGDAAPATVPTPAPANLVQALAVAAADPRMDVAKVERLWAMHKEMMDREREAAFNDSMARAQAKVVPIVKDRRNDHTKSMYATLAAINDAITPIYTAEGLSVSFDSYSPERDKDLPPLDPGMLRVVGFCSHRGGHTRKYHLDGALDDAGAQGNRNKTGIQATGSTVSYLRRYLVCMIFNVATADDNDGNGAGNGGQKMAEGKLTDHCSAIEAAATDADIMKAFGKGWNEAEDLKDKDAQRVLMAKRDECRKKLRQGARR